MVRPLQCAQTQINVQVLSYPWNLNPLSPTLKHFTFNNLQLDYYCQNQFSKNTFATSCNLIFDNIRGTNHPLQRISVNSIINDVAIA